MINLPIKKNAPPTGGHVFQATGTIFELVQNIIGTNFHDDQTINMASRVLTRKNARTPWRPYIIGTYLLTTFHDDRTIKVASRVLTRKNAPPPDIIRTNLLTKFHEDWKMWPLEKNAPPPGGHVFIPTSIIFELVHDIIGMNLLTQFQEDRTINVAFRVKNAPTLGSHVSQANVTIFELIQDIIDTNLLTQFHEDWTINVASRVFTRKNAPPLGSHVFQANTINVASRVLTRKTAPPTDINKTNVLTKFHDDWAKIVFIYSHIRNTAPPPGGHVFQRTGTIFELNQHII
ncbi:hypothetical protein DPMN_193218 [Dreissena polymorpha]|uniref:Uncharacterized protein n=1 Tax=Dreissena polymorpha TaxID=45954 RepID=A0A9D3Y369_DREPO|nr:hypothetical protein DPMN_193218 [Dreissena polymorpha]